MKSSEHAILRRQVRKLQRKRAIAPIQALIPLPFRFSYPVFQTFLKRLVTTELNNGQIT